MTRRFVVTALSLSAVVALQACRTPTSPRMVQRIEIQLAAEKFTIGSGVTIFIARGESLQLAASAVLSDSSRQDVTTVAQWSTDNPAAVSISLTGVATGLAPGTARISASLNNLTGTATLASQ